MSKLSACSPAKMIRVLERAGFVLARQRGSHGLYVKDNIALTVAAHNKDLKRGTLRHIIKQSGLTLEEFKKLL